MNDRAVSARLRRDGVFEIIFDRLPVNSLRDADYAALTAALLAAPTAGAGCVLLGARGRLFCAGGDLHQRDSGGSGRSNSDLPLTLLAEMRRCPLPILTRVQGTAAGFGVLIALRADVVLAADDIEFVLPEIDTGAIGGFRGAVDVMPLATARFMALTGRRVPVAHFVEAGIVARAVPSGQLDAKADALAATIAGRVLASRLPDWREWRIVG